MPHGCGRDGEPGDGPSFWPWENLWMLHFADALKNVTGEDLYREFPKRLETSPEVVPVSSGAAGSDRRQAVLSRKCRT